MKPLVKLECGAATVDRQRRALLEKQDECFRDYFDGRVPSPEEKLAWIETAVQRMSSIECYENDLYSVLLERGSPFIRLTIRRLDGQPFKTWKHLQVIKNQLIGPDHEAAELFPAESRLVDGANEYHLWVHADPSFRFPFGFKASRVVVQEAVLPVEGETMLVPSMGDASRAWVG